jgi:tetratricopeptide (TPR) repeat protein
MEGKKYRFVILLVSLSIVASAQNNFQQKVYESFISGDMEGWKNSIDQMENRKSDNGTFLSELVNYEYGYIGWCLGNNEKKQAKFYLEQMENNLKKLKNIEGATALYHAYMSAYYGFRIGLSPWRAPFWGPKSMEHAENALAADSLNFQANTEMGNIWNHMPALFGGSDEKALTYYKKAMDVFEKNEFQPEYKKWLYLNIVATTGQIEYEQKNYSKALQLYQKALKIEPKFKWVKNELLPELNNEMN